MVLLLLFFCAQLGAVPTGQIITDGFIPNPAYALPESPNLPMGFPPCTRVFDVYLPPHYDANKSYPIVYHLGGLGADESTYSDSDKAVMDQMICQGTITPLIIIFPDGSSNQYSGLWYINSALQGDFESYMINQLIPYVNSKYKQKADFTHNSAPYRAIMGQSMGGYGSLYYGVKYPNLFSAFAGDSPTGFWVIATDLASPDGNPMYTFNKLVIPELNCYLQNNPLETQALINANNVQPDPENSGTFSLFTWSAAFSPNTDRCCPFSVNLPLISTFVPDPLAPTGPTGPTSCTDSPACGDCDNQAGGFLPAFAGCSPTGAPYASTCSATPAYTGCSFVPDAQVLAQWATFNPYFFLDTADKEKLKRQVIYLDAGNLDYIDNVGARFFSDKLTALNLNHEYMLYGKGYTGPSGSDPDGTGGTHTFCTDPTDSPTQYQPYGCYRFSTNLKLFSGKFAEGGYYAPDIRATITGTGAITLFENASMRVENLVGIETLATPGAQSAISLELYNNAQVIIGGKTTGALQVGNAVGKAQLVNTPALITNSIDFSLVINGTGAAFSLLSGGFLGFAVGVNGNQTPSANTWALSTLAHTRNISLTLDQGTFVHNTIAPSNSPQASLFAVGNALSVPRSEPQTTAYTISLTNNRGLIKGGGNFVEIIDSNYIHPTVIAQGGQLEPGGIRHTNLINAGDPTDNFPGNPVPYYKNIGSKTFYRNLLQSGILASSEIVLLNNSSALNPVLNKQVPVDQFFKLLSLGDYVHQEVKSAPASCLNTSCLVDFITQGYTQTEPCPINSKTTPTTINRTALASVGLLSQTQAALGIKLVPSTSTVITTYDLDPY